jgi:hypothetical protein
VHRNALLDALVRPHRVEVIQSVFLQNALQVSFVQNDDVIQTLASNATEKAFANRIHQWRAHRRFDHANTGAFRRAVEVRAELVISVTNDESRTFTERRVLQLSSPRPTARLGR